MKNKICTLLLKVLVFESIAVGSNTLTRFFLKNGSDYAVQKTPEFLYVALYFNRPKIVRSLVEMGVNTNLVFDLASGKLIFDAAKGYTPLHLAVMRGMEDIVKLLLNKGANIKAEGLHKYSPLHNAAMYGKYLISI